MVGFLLFFLKSKTTITSFLDLLVVCYMVDYVVYRLQ